MSQSYVTYNDTLPVSGDTIHLKGDKFPLENPKNGATLEFQASMHASKHDAESIALMFASCSWLASWQVYQTLCQAKGVLVFSIHSQDRLPCQMDNSQELVDLISQLLVLIGRSET